MGKMTESELTVSTSTLTVATLDAGYAWVVLVAACFVMAVSGGNIACYGLFYPEFLVAFQSGEIITSWVTALQVGLINFFALVAGLIIERFGNRLACMAGTSCMAAGMIITAFASNIVHLYIGYGVLTGIGGCLHFIPAVIAVQEYFDKRRSLAIGVIYCSAGLGGFVLAPVCRFLQTYYGWRGAMIMISGIVIQCLVPACLFVPNKSVVSCDVPESRKNSICNSSSSGEPLDKRTVEFIKDSLLAHPVIAQTENYISSPDVDAINLVVEAADPQITSNMDNTYRSTQSLATTGVMDVRLSDDVGQLENELAKQVGSVSPGYRDEEQGICNFTHPETSFKSLDSAFYDLKTNSHDGTMCDYDIKRTSSAEDCNTTSEIFSNHPADLIVNTQYSLQKPGCTKHTKLGLTSSNDFLDRIRRPKLYIPAEVLEKENKDSVDDPDSDYNLGKCRARCAESVVADPAVLLLAFAWFLNMQCYLLCYVFLPTKASESGISPAKISFIVSVLALGDTLGRLFFGCLANFRQVDKLFLFASAISLCGAITMLGGLLNSFAEHLLFGFVFGACMGGTVTLQCPVAGEEYPKNPVRAFSFLLAVGGVSGSVSSPLSAFLHETTGSYVYLFIISGLFQLTGALFVFVLLLLKKIRGADVKQDDTSEVCVVPERDYLKPPAEGHVIDRFFYNSLPHLNGRSCGSSVGSVTFIAAPSVALRKRVVKHDRRPKRMLV